MKISVLDIEIEIDLTELEVEMIDRIFNKNLKPDLSEIGSKLKKTGKLRDTFEISNDSISVQDYIISLEKIYGEIVNLSEVELEIIALEITKQLSTKILEKWTLKN